MPEIVQKLSYGSVKVFWLNKETLRKGIKKRVKNLINSNKNIKKVILFGSLAQNRATPFSDIDILIIVDKENRPFLDRPLIYKDYFSGIGMDIDLFVYTKEEFENTSFSKHIEKTGIVLFNS